MGALNQILYSREQGSPWKRRWKNFKSQRGWTIPEQDPLNQLRKSHRKCHKLKQWVCTRYVCLYVCLYVFVSVCVYYICMYVCMYMYVCMHACNVCACLSCSRGGGRGRRGGVGGGSGDMCTYMVCYLDGFG